MYKCKNIISYFISKKNLARQNLLKNQLQKKVFQLKIRIYENNLSGVISDSLKVFLKHKTIA